MKNRTKSKRVQARSQVSPAHRLLGHRRRCVVVFSMSRRDAGSTSHDDDSAGNLRQAKPVQRSQSQSHIPTISHISIWTVSAWFFAAVVAVYVFFLPISVHFYNVYTKASVTMHESLREGVWWGKVHNSQQCLSLLGARKLNFRKWSVGLSHSEKLHHIGGYGCSRVYTYI